MLSPKKSMGKSYRKSVSWGEKSLFKVKRRDETGCGIEVNVVKKERME